uniref:Coat protein n=1 Tax=Mint vein banding-associated virus TaxID=265877 RepID=A0A1S5YCY5_9CLOS|nr:coat protein [Mint vein banding-associated virus]
MGNDDIKPVTGDSSNPEITVSKSIGDFLMNPDPTVTFEFDVKSLPNIKDAAAPGTISDKSFAYATSELKRTSGVTDDKLFNENYMIGVCQLLVYHNTCEKGPPAETGFVTVDIGGRDYKIVWQEVKTVIDRALHGAGKNPLRLWAKRLSPLCSALIKDKKIKIADTTAASWGSTGEFDEVCFDFYVPPKNADLESRSAAFMKTKVAFSQKNATERKHKEVNVIQTIDGYRI